MYDDKIESLRHLLDTAPNPQKHLQSLNELAWELTRNDVPRARSIAEEVVERASRLAPLDEATLMHSRLVLAECDRVAGEVERAISEATACLDYYDTPSLEQVKALHILGLARSALGENLGALEMHLRHVETAEKIGNATWAATGMRYIGGRYVHHEDFVEAAAWYERCRIIYEQQGDELGQAVILSNLCYIYRVMGQAELALTYGEQGLAMADAVGDLLAQGVVHANLGLTYLNLKAFDEALAHLNQAYEVAMRSGETYLYAASLTYLGRLHQRQGEYAQAIAHFEGALAHLQTSPNPQQTQECYADLAETYEAWGKIEDAYRYLKMSRNLQERLLRHEAVSGLKAFEKSYALRQATIEAETQRQLREQDRAYFERLARLKDELLLTATHDLKNPLGSIAIWVGLMRYTLPESTPAQEQALSGIERATEQMRGLIHDLFDFARLETGRALSPSQHDLLSFLVIALHQFDSLAQHRQIRLTFVAQAGDAEVSFDPRRLKQVVENLLSNALKYTPAGGSVTVRISLNETHATVTVVDTGYGIPAEALPHIFEPFYRVQDDQHREIEGTGFGLAIAKAIVEQHGGEIWVESTVGQGSTFGFSLPLAAKMSPIA